MWVPYKNYVSAMLWYFMRSGRKVRKSTKLPKIIRVKNETIRKYAASIEGRLMIIPHLPHIPVMDMYRDHERISIAIAEPGNDAYRLAMNLYLRKAIEVLSILGYDVIGIIELLKDKLEYYADIDPDHWQQAISDYLHFFWDIEPMSDMDWAYFFMKCVDGSFIDTDKPYEYLHQIEYTNYGYYNTHANAYYGIAPAYETLLEIGIDIPQMGLQSMLTNLIKRTLAKYDRALRLDFVEQAGHWSLILHRLAKAYGELVESPADDYVRLLTDELEMIEKKQYKIYSPQELKELPAPPGDDSAKENSEQ